MRRGGRLEDAVTTDAVTTDSLTTDAVALDGSVVDNAGTSFDGRGPGAGSDQSVVDTGD
jgi:hypothetical protein